MAEQSKKVLIITYYWPPGSGPGVQRFLKMSKFLPQLGWKPVVLTVKNGSYPSYDETLLEEIPDELSTYRTKTIEPFTIYNRLTGGKGKKIGVGMIGMHHKKSLAKKISLYIRANYFFPDARKGWIPFAYKKALKIIRNEKIDVVVTTGPPHSSHIIGLKLKRKLGIPWLVDMRDPWVNNFFNMSLPRTNRTIRKEKKYEDLILSKADSVTTVSQGLRNEFADRNSKTEVIYNGYDAEDIPEPSRNKQSEFLLSYVGNLKPNQNIHALWEAISELKEEISDFSDYFRINLTGNLDEGIKEEFRQLNLLEMSRINPFVPHKEATRIMDRSGLLLFIVPQARSNKMIITGKLFEYIATRSPVLPVGPTDGNAAAILRESNREDMIEYSDKEKIKELIVHYFNKWKEDGFVNFKHPASNTRNFSRFASTEKLAAILKDLAYDH